jgi:hypothetical protein
MAVILATLIIVLSPRTQKGSPIRAPLAFIVARGVKFYVCKVLKSGDKWRVNDILRRNEKG